MFSKLISEIKKEIFAFSLKERLFILCIIPCIFFIMGEYSVTRPPSDSIFISNYGTAYFPYVWLATVPLNFLIVYLYNRFLPRLGCFRTFGISCFLIVFINVLNGMLLKSFPSIIFFQYAWKDIYILLIFKQLWSMIHSTIKVNQAKYLYGFLFAMGGVGATVCSLIPGFFALSLGSNHLFYFTLPFYLAIFFFYVSATKYSQVPHTINDFKNRLFSDGSGSKGGYSLFKSSKFLKFILVLVVFMQISVALLYYQFNLFLEISFPDVDLRTAYSGKLHSIVNLITIAFQVFIGSFFIHFLGLKRSHLMLPITLCFNGILFLFKPTFGMISYLYGSIKAIDFSLFTLFREMLYVPLKLDEKFRAKAIIDVFAYRTAKAGASFLLLFLQEFVQNIIPFITLFTLIIFMVWLFIILQMFKEKQHIDVTIS